MAKIKSVEAILVDVPTIRPHVLAMSTMNQQTLVILQIRCDDGMLGTGEATTIGGLSYGDESPEGIKLAIDTYLAPLLIGADGAHPAMVMDAIGKSVVGNMFAKCAVETALLDAQARRIGVPLSELLGGRRRDRLPVAWTLASGNTSTDIDEAEAMLAARRHNIFKLKIGKRAVADDVAHVAAISRQGDTAFIAFDFELQRASASNDESFSARQRLAVG